MPDAAPVVNDDDGGGGVRGVGGWLASPYATRTPEVEERVLRGLEKGAGAGVPEAEVDEAAAAGGRGTRACETPGRSAPPSLARFGRLVRCCQSW
jgi:hypothetical protein